MTDSHTGRLESALAGRYRIQRKLGEGGMASVYLAEDLKHERKVALKVLKPELAAVLGAERFVQEIKTTAALSHPHILPLFDSGEAGGFLYYVMPYIQGETIREKLNRETQFGVEESVRIATEVADALDYAHRNGVIHRDIKPENILLHDGRPMVMDFGIAIAVSAAAGGRMTETGLSLGTPHYMSPEQATADKQITARSDVYSLASVLYEMLAGEPPHTGGSAQAIIMKIIAERAQAVTELRGSVPPNVAAALARALEKLPADRFDSASEFVHALSDPAFRYGTEGAAAEAASSNVRAWKARALGASAVAVLSLGAALWGFTGSRTEAVSPVVLTLDFGRLETRGDVKISPDGSTFAVVAFEEGQPRRLWVRRVDEADFRPLPGTEDAVQPDFSPRGDWLVYRHTERDALMKVPLTGGNPTVVLYDPDLSPLLPVWGPTGDIAFLDAARGAFLVSETGAGGARPLTPSGTINDFLPDGRGALGTLGDEVFVIDLDGGSPVPLVRGVSPRFLRTGHVLYRTQEGVTFVVGFDPVQRMVVGEPVPVRDDVDPVIRAAGYDVSEGGTLVFRRGSAGGSGGGVERIFVFADRTGGLDTVPIPARYIDNPKISPDGRWVVYGSTGRQLHLLDLVTGSTPELTVGAGRTFDPAWSPDGRRVLFGAAETGGGAGLYVVPVDRSEEPRQVLAGGSASLYPGSWGSDGTAIVNARIGGNSNLWTLNPDSAADPSVYLDADYSEHWPILSPDGAHVAFQSNETGVWEVYVRDYPVPTGKWKISEGGGTGARWSPSGDELYFWKGSSSGLDSLFAVPVVRSPGFDPGDPHFLFALRLRPFSDFADQDNWDVHPDGRFLVTVDVGAQDSDGPEPRQVVILNWFDELARVLGGG